MRLFQLALVCLFAFIQYKLWFGHNGVKDYTRLKLAVHEHQLVNDNLSKRNKLLKADVEDLKIGLDGIEERARNELGLIKPGETFYRVLPGKQK
ncbi:cell division protein FtsB [Pseudoalteromonas tunicata]|jgi:cell division protein FtsB|uniref:Cell division protein FtsB n=1 Tax=Pseudoalteromonas tunicata D2 TaxID=87626 RepID=A4C6Z8_9GAMM|nr:cell division protein FtsB [Pseudoalteromonas tunicata]ATC95722.1 cell division protein FtsB [Pseudoalteromonas tunicata]AXT31278.1 cell division protein FtsB [Pseudoalteromonas tunicata]EAR29752.1 putative cell division protein; septum localization dependent on Ftsl and FtsQ [Pseudoalteromonas tunicata D2]MDP4985658.1 cell division protein FtsB [Pseudoalteromonas tunicata]MDP5213989.1 cell division protein FtsB [Pseudoalteromonas tunicata]